jgi:hypothetical protein
MYPTAESKSLYRAPKELIEDQQKAYDELNKNIEFFHPWQCISLHLKNSTLDLVVKDKSELFALITILNVHLLKVPIPLSTNCLKAYKLLRIK